MTRIVYKLVKPTSHPDIYHSASIDRGDWIVVYTVGKWVGPQFDNANSLLFCFATLEAARQPRWRSGLVLFKAEAEGYIMPIEFLAPETDLLRFWYGDLSYFETLRAPEGTLGVSRLKLIERID